MQICYKYNAYCLCAVCGSFSLFKEEFSSCSAALADVPLQTWVYRSQIYAIKHRIPCVHCRCRDVLFCHVIDVINVCWRCFDWFCTSRTFKHNWIVRKNSNKTVCTVRSPTSQCWLWVNVYTTVLSLKTKTFRHHRRGRADDDDDATASHSIHCAFPKTIKFTHRSPFSQPNILSNSDAIENVNNMRPASYLRASCAVSRPGNFATFSMTLARKYRWHFYCLFAILLRFVLRRSHSSHYFFLPYKGNPLTDTMVGNS